VKITNYETKVLLDTSSSDSLKLRSPRRGARPSFTPL